MSSSTGLSPSWSNESHSNPSVFPCGRGFLQNCPFLYLFVLSDWQFLGIFGDVAWSAPELLPAVIAILHLELWSHWTQSRRMYRPDLRGAFFLGCPATTWCKTLNIAMAHLVRWFPKVVIMILYKWPEGRLSSNFFNRMRMERRNIYIYKKYSIGSTIQLVESSNVRRKKWGSKTQRQGRKLAIARPGGQHSPQGAAQQLPLPFAWNCLSPQHPWEPGKVVECNPRKKIPPSPYQMMVISGRDYIHTHIDIYIYT